MSIKSKKYDVEYIYDSIYDILAFKVKRQFKYYETLEMDEGIHLDFDINREPTALEIMDASKRFNISKESLNDLNCVSMDVIVTDKIISLNAKFGVIIQEKENKQSLETIIQNNYNIPSMKTELVVA